MEYNTQREKMPVPEYGRNVQKMIEYAVSIPDRDKRNKAATAIVAIMGQLSPHLRDYADFRHKLWDHMFIISDFKLDVDSPYPIPSELALAEKPKRVSYPTNKIRFRHYGKVMQKIIDEIIKLDEGPEKDSMIVKIANFMKMSYLNWNRDSVNDELIIEHLTELSGGKLTLKDTARLHLTSDILAKNPKKVIPSKGKNQKFRRDNSSRRRGK